MARVTVEDCVQKVPNRFELVLLAAQRARTDQNIFGLQDVTAEEETASLPVEGEEMSPEDLEAAIEAELGGRPRR
jgi:DNA-directed RNA polymerase omega subunit